MSKVTRISIAVVCALGMSPAMAQSIQRGDANAAPTPARAPVQVAQAPAGGAATGASTTGATVAPGISTTMTVVIIGVAAVAIAASGSSNNPAVVHP